MRSNIWVTRERESSAASASVALGLAYIGDVVPLAERQATIARFVAGSMFGQMVGPLVGAFIPTVLNNGFVINGIDPFWQEVLVGATIVGSMATIWHGVVNPRRTGKPSEWRYDDEAIVLRKGEEMGRFLLGSTIVMLFRKGSIVSRGTLGSTCSGAATCRTSASSPL